jgi:hypothetical protein
MCPSEQKSENPSASLTPLDPNSSGIAMKMQIVCLTLLLGTAGAARADHNYRGGDHDWFHGRDTPSLQAPELDPSSMISGLTLLAGALVVLRGRRAAKPKG